MSAAPQAHGPVGAPSSGIFVPGSGLGASAAEIGGKAANLAALAGLVRRHWPNAGVPPWFAIPASVYDRLAGAPTAAATADELDARRRAILAIEPPDALRREVHAALERTELIGRWLAVRSSAVGEDAAGASFAGQFETVLGVRAGDDDRALWDAIRRVWASTHSAHAAAYAQRAEGAGPPPRMAVIVQELVDAEVSGVAFAADPVSGDRDVAVVSAVYGLGEGLVSGTLDADTYRIRFDGLEPRELSREIARKEQAVRRQPDGGTRLEPLAVDRRDAPALDDSAAREIAQGARRLSLALHRAQDIEWALTRDADGRWTPWVLQTRPITTLPAHAAALVAERRIWDNSNIAESYSGVTTPLTFSFARAVYEDVYRQFCRLMGVSESLLVEHQPVFANMLGLIRGRVYYNLLNWYRTLALLPGFSFNRAFMERMMGVGQALADPPAPPRSGNRWVDLARLVRALARMLIELTRLPGQVPAFHGRVHAALLPVAGVDLSRWSADELAALYRRLERELLRHWRAPLVNDFFAMVFFGTLGRLIERWLPHAPHTLANDLLCGEGGIISTEPARQVMALAREVTRTPAVTAAFAELSDTPDPDETTRWWARARRRPELREFANRVDAYVARFGDRCMEELKLETVALGEDPSFLLQMIRAYAGRGTVDPDAALAREREIRGEAEKLVRASLTGPRRWLFTWVLGQARARVRDRENLRFERTRVFGVVRRILLGFGHHLAGTGRLERPRDVFYLTIEEVLGWVEGSAAGLDLRGIAALRRAEFEAYAAGPAPPDRFETVGPPGEVGELRPASAPGRVQAEAKGDELRGTGCCPGVVRERVRVVRDPRDAGELAGRILVAERTDPGWTLLFPAARGLLVQRGSLLSHSAIVAREMGLPCVVGIAGLLDTVRDGEEVEMDGATGVVKRLEAVR